MKDKRKNKRKNFNSKSFHINRLYVQKERKERFKGNINEGKRRKTLRESVIEKTIW